LGAARAVADVALCHDHDGPQQIATGSMTVFFNGMPASRLGDQTVCDARISSASPNVIIGGGTGQYAAISAEVSPLEVTIARDMAIGGTAVALGAGAGAAFLAAGWAGVGVFGMQAAGGLALGAAGSVAGGAIGGAIDPVHGAAWGQAIGGVGGGAAGGLAGGAAAGRMGLSGSIAGDAAAGDSAASAETVSAVRSADEVNAEMAANGDQPAWMPGTTVTTKTVPPGTQYNMVMADGQANAAANGAPAFGGWATEDTVPSQASARNDMAITPGFKDDVSRLATVETTAPQTVNSGTVGPQGSLPGGGSQVQFLGQRNLRTVGIPSQLPPGS
jgi:hypothetical protein